MGEPDAPVPDIAASDPEISSDGLAYTVKIRDGVRWDVPAGRQLTAPDVVRGQAAVLPGRAVTRAALIPGHAQGDGAVLHRSGAPTPGRAGSGLPGRDGAAGRPRRQRQYGDLPSAARSNDFLSLLTLPAASPVPTEVLRAEQTPGILTPFASDGPNRIVERTPGGCCACAATPSGTSGRPVRTAFVDGVEIDVDVSADEAQARLRSGEADLAWGSELARGDAISLRAGRSRRALQDRGARVVLVFNLRHPGPLLDVRSGARSSTARTRRRSHGRSAQRNSAPRGTGAGGALGAGPYAVHPGVSAPRPVRDEGVGRWPGPVPASARRRRLRGLRLSVVPVGPDALEEAGAEGYSTRAPRCAGPAAGSTAAGVTLAPLPVRHDVVAIVAGRETAPDWDLAGVVVARHGPATAPARCRAVAVAGGVNDLGGYQSGPSPGHHRRRCCNRRAGREGPLGRAGQFASCARRPGCRTRG